MSPEEYEEIKREIAGAVNVEMLFADGFRDALMGTVQVFNNAVALYDYERCIDILIDRDGSTYEQAVEHLEYNTLGSYVGDNTPGYFMRHECLQAKDKKSKVMSLMERVMSTMASMTDVEREEMFIEMKYEFCVHCGRHTPGKEVCHCWNDE